MHTKRLSTAQRTTLGRHITQLDWFPHTESRAAEIVIANEFDRINAMHLYGLFILFQH